MDKVEVTKIIEKIKAFRQSFLITNNLLDEWYKILKPYRYEDVNKKLDDYFKETNNFGQYPDAYYLTRYLRTEEELENKQEIYVRCQLCGKKIIYYDLTEHYDKCSSIDYIHTNGLKYLGRNFDKEKLWEMSNDKFNELYWKFCDELHKVIKDDLQKRALENAILTHNGQEPKYTIEECMEV